MVVQRLIGVTVGAAIAATFGVGTAFASDGAVVSAAAAASAANPALGGAPASTLEGPAAALFERMVKVNADLRSFKADLHAQVALKTFPYINPTVDGSVYFKSPNQTAAVFDTLPALASQFKKVYPNVPRPAEWPRVY